VFMGNLFDVVHQTHEITVSHCAYCDEPLTESDVNDYGTLCESCYMKEYYGQEDWQNHYTHQRFRKKIEWSRQQP